MRDGRGFVGASGKLIWHSTHGTGAADLASIKRADTLVTNMVNTQPEHNDWSKHAPDDLVRGVAELQALLAAHPRTLVVALGEQAALGCMGIKPELDSRMVSAQFAEHFGDSITNCRGYIYSHPVGGLRLLVACHPAFILRNWHPWWATFCWDFAKAARILQAGGFQAHKVEVEVLDSTQAIEQWWGGVVARGTRLVANDCETQGMGCIGFADTPWHAVVVPSKPDRAHPLYDAVVRVLNNAEGIGFVLQNGQFDWTMYARAGMVPEREWPQYRHDLMLGWHAAEPLLAGQREDARGKGKRKTEKSLEFLAGLLLDGAQKWKNYVFTSDLQQYELCGIDCGYTLGCWHKLEKRLSA